MQALASRDVAAEPPRRPRRPKPRRRFPAEVLSDPEVRALLDACGSYHPIGLRNRALIALTATAVPILLRSLKQSVNPTKAKRLRAIACGAQSDRIVFGPVTERQTRRAQSPLCPTGALSSAHASHALTCSLTFCSRSSLIRST